MKWFLDHFIFPAIIVFLGIIVNNSYQEKKLPNIVATAKHHQITKISDDQFKVKCPFEILNNGGTSTKNTKLTLLIPGILTIHDIEISREYISFYKKTSGGRGFSYVVYAVNLPKGKNIEGTIVFFSNVNIPEKAMCPLQIIY